MRRILDPDIIENDPNVNRTSAPLPLHISCPSLTLVRQLTSDCCLQMDERDTTLSQQYLMKVRDVLDDVNFHEFLSIVSSAKELKSPTEVS